MHAASAPGAYQKPVNSIGFIVFCGVALPLLALLAELALGVFSHAPFNPLPSGFHGILIALVPLSNLALAFALGEGKALPAPLSALHGCATGVALVYTLIFLPITPIAALGILFFGIGLLPLAPLLSLVAALRGRVLLRRASGVRAPWFWRGMALGLACLLALEAPAALTRIGLHLATAASPVTAERGVRWLRAVGSDDILLHHGHGRARGAAGLAGNLLDLHDTVSPEAAQHVFYRVTGATFESRPAPAAAARSWLSEQGWSLPDMDQGGERVGQRNDALQLTSSRIDGSADAGAALAYLEWTMEFANGDPRAAEGRVEIQLPPGAVVSRATLWINGEEREAAFGGRAQVRAAYEKIVKQQRDPLLVTTAGKDRVLVQLFPIPPKGSMKIRIGISAPMQLAQLERAELLLPVFGERNFALADGLQHAVWIESGARMLGPAALREETVNATRFALRGMLADRADGTAAAIAAVRTAPSRSAWSRDQHGGDDAVVVQSFAQVRAEAPRRVALVLDGSVSLAAHAGGVAEAMAALPPAAELAIFFAGDGAPVVYGGAALDRGAAARFIAAQSYEGGRSNRQVLGAALAWAGADQQTAIVWIHGPQLDPMAAQIEQQIQAGLRRSGPTLYDLQAAPGPNDYAARLERHLNIARVIRTGPVADDLRRLFGQWRPDAAHWVATRTRIADGSGLPPDAQTSPHLARLWAAGKVAQLMDEAPGSADATALAVRYQLVTPVSGAVVLETAAQYKDAGLEPVAPGTVPTIPEPETWLLIGVALAVLALRHRHRSA